MRKLHLLIPALALTVVLGSCSSGGDEETPAEETSGQPATEQPAPTATAPATPPAAAPTPEAEAQPEEGEPSDLLSGSGARLSPVFIPSTDPDARRNATAEGRNDPFADFTFKPTSVTFVPEPPPEPVAAPPQNVPRVTPVASTPSAPSTPTPVANNGGNNNATLVTLDSGSNAGSVSSALDFSPILPDLPTASLAEETEVTGVVTLNGVDNIMVKAPNEEYSRYVQVGDLIADGQVKVKRVDFRRNSPVVVLEQLGIEVYKEIDDVLLADRDSSPSPDTEASEG
ncbi:hypothetical protein Lepto7376_2721 [[Leptolyngbya] sp. PCC 7376]|uniref:hypothetical protein n=1 Tax=[Leptolyngbya] sp. PCC 7376 TaxID=111781 RepID=UPI00029F1F16|nr:hypothetical protein [[Leptolyngbya] sp. PCC 7376]AFY38985.1 hypothetical protein Lepto7376_2721 [[Leptolyngbya] sp. PCC 7376]